METKETSSRTESEVMMLENTDYFKYIFKKTEKIACAVFYILRSSSHISQTDAVVNDLESATRELLTVSLSSLRETPHTIDREAKDLRHALLRLESCLRIAYAARIMSTESLGVFLHEIDTVHRSLRKYIETTMHPLDEMSHSIERVREKRTSRPRTELAGATMNASLNIQPGRRERILNVLRDKGQATIKDIVEVVNDCSEKTIQRELISLIKDNVVLREGERRWSKYSVI